MKIVAALDRHTRAGTLTATTAGSSITARCLGMVDSAYAAQHNNPTRDPEHLGGVHPFGTYRVLHAIRYTPNDPDYHTYGPAFLVLDPVDGEALSAKKNGRKGLAIHGGAQTDDGKLRPTYGCLRVPDTVALWLAESLDADGEATYVVQPAVLA